MLQYMRAAAAFATGARLVADADALRRIDIIAVVSTAKFLFGNGIFFAETFERVARADDAANPSLRQQKKASGRRKTIEAVFLHHGRVGDAVRGAYRLQCIAGADDVQPERPRAAPFAEKT